VEKLSPRPPIERVRRLSVSELDRGVEKPPGANADLYEVELSVSELDRGVEKQAINLG